MLPLVTHVLQQLQGRTATDNTIAPCPCDVRPAYKQVRTMTRYNAPPAMMAMPHNKQEVACGPVGKCRPVVQDFGAWPGNHATQKGPEEPWPVHMHQQTFACSAHCKIWHVAMRHLTNHSTMEGLERCLPASEHTASCRTQHVKLSTKQRAWPDACNYTQGQVAVRHNTVACPSSLGFQ